MPMTAAGKRALAEAIKDPKLDALLDEVRSRVLPEIEAGRRVRIV